MKTFTGRGKDRSGLTPEPALVKTDAEIARERRERALYLATHAGGAELHEAVSRITQDDRNERLAGALKLKELKSGESFAPLLDAAEKEKDPEVKLQLLKALCATVKAREFAKPPDLVERLEKLILAETDELIARQAAIALYLHGPHDRSDGFEYMRGLRDQAEETHGKEHPVPKGITAAIMHLRDSDEI